MLHAWAQLVAEAGRGVHRWRNKTRALMQGGRSHAHSIDPAHNFVDFALQQCDSFQCHSWGRFASRGLMAPAPIARPFMATLRVFGRAGVGLALGLATAAIPGRIAAHAGAEDKLPIGDALETIERAAGGISIDVGAPPAVLELPIGAEPNIAVSKQTGGPEMKLKWRSERYAPVGPDGLQIDGNASGVEIGVSYRPQSAITIGALAQFDPAAEMVFGSLGTLSDHGWMAGPVTTVNFAPGLVLEARAAWGAAESGADDLAGMAPAAQRRLISARLVNPQAVGAWRFTPSVNFSHFQEVLPMPSHAQAETSGPHVAGSGRIDVAPEVAYRFEVAPTAFVEPKVVVGSFWAFDDLAKLAPSAGTHLEARMKAGAGVTLGIVDGPKLQALGAVEGGERTAPDAWTGRLKLRVP